jgi:hypothetical protein
MDLGEPIREGEILPAEVPVPVPDTVEVQEEVEA